MSTNSPFDHFTSQQTQALEWLHSELSGIRTGRVKTSLIEGLPVEHYGARTPLQGLASLGISDARTIVITPWDPTALTAIEKALTEANLGVNPVMDGKVVRLNFPSLTEEMREKTIKMVHKIAEDGRVRLRKARDESLNMIKKDKEDSAITEDDFYEQKEKLDKMITDANTAIADVIGKKEEDLRTI